MKKMLAALIKSFGIWWTAFTDSIKERPSGMKPFRTDGSSRYWQITIIARDEISDPHDGGYLNSALIEAGIKFNRLPLFLKIHDVEAIEIGDKPYSINPLPHDLER